MSDADRFRAAKATSTDPERLEREAQRAEGKAMTMLEKATRALYERNRRFRPDIVCAWEELSSNTAEDWISNVRAVLSAIREVDDAMLSAANAVGIDMDPRDYWPAMVDAILAGKQESVPVGTGGGGEGTAGNNDGPSGSPANNSTEEEK